jgi:hypothetical protein
MKGSRFFAVLLSGCLVFSGMPVMAAKPENVVATENPTNTSGIVGGG